MHKILMAIVMMAFFFPNSLFAVDLENQLNDTFKSLEMLKEAQKSITRDDIQKQFESKPWLKKITNKFPKIIDFVTNIIKDENVMPELVKMMQNKKDLWRFFYINVGLFIFSFLWKLTYRKKNFFSFSFLINMFARFFVITGLRLYALVYLFGDNLAPLWNVFKDTFELF